MKPGQAKAVAELQKNLVKKHLKDAAQLWGRLEFPTAEDGDNLLDSYAPEALRYAQQGKKFVQYALEHGTIKAKSRVRDEWKARCYGEGIDHKTTQEDTGFDAAVAAYKKRTQRRKAAYFRNG